jgi:hypothetical protein
MNKTKYKTHQSSSPRLSWCILGLFILVALLPEPLPAVNPGKLHFYITNDFLYQYNKLSESENQFYESLSLFANYHQWSLGITLRGNNFFKQTPNDTFADPQFDVYRKYIRYNSKNLEVTAGDFYALLGRGLVLSVLKNEDVLRERTILGGDIHYNKGRLDWRVLGGRIKDETREEEWNVAAAEVTLEYAKNHRAGIHFSYIDDVNTWSSPGKRYTYSVSLQGTKLFKNFSYYSEVAGLDYRDIPKDSGYGIFSNITYNKSHITCFLEFKRYVDFNNEMNNPPGADREDDEASSINDTTGLRFYFQYAFFEPDIILFVTFGRYKEFFDTGNHIYAGIEIEDLMERLNLTLSYGIKDIHYPIKRLDGHLLYQFSDRWSSEITIKDKRYKDGSFTFNEQDHTLQVSYSPSVSLFFMHQYSHNRVIDLNHFYSGGIKIYFSGGTVIELSGGTIRGGQICSGGQCFVAPPFKGIKCSILHTFK